MNMEVARNNHNESTDYNPNLSAFLTDMFSDSVLVLDFSGQIVYANSAACSFFGYEREELLTKSLFDLDTGESTEAKRAGIQSIIRNGQATFEGLSFPTTGTRFPVRVNAHLLPYEGQDLICCLIKDISEKKSDERRLTESENLFKTMFENAPEAYYMSTTKGVFLDCNQMVEKLVGYHKQELIGKNFVQIGLFSLGQIMKVSSLLYKNSLGESTGPDEFVLIRKDGAKVPVEISTQVIEKDGQKVLISMARDITEHKKLEIMVKRTNRLLEEQVKKRTTEMTASNQALEKEIAERLRVENLLRESETRLKAIFDLVPCGIMLVDAHSHKIKEINKLGQELFGASLEEIVGRECHQFICPAQKGACPITDLNKPVDREERSIITKSGETIAVLKSVSRITIGEAEYLLESFIDITERKKANDALRYHSMHDQLTGIYNRNYYEEELRRLKSVPGVSLALTICDVDGLKIINDTMGHEQGDLLLKNVAGILSESFPRGAMIARIGGDEFAIIMTPCTEKSVEEYCITLRNKIEKANENSNIKISVSIGFATGNTNESEIAALVKQADDNMYRDKMLHHSSSSNALVQTLKNALGERDFVTSGHADRMQYVAECFAQGLNLPERKVSDLSLLAQFHDIGKVGIPDAILFKPAALSPEEKAIMQKHSEIGHRIAESASILSDIGDLILKHHEWWNGEGYPLGLKGEEIPLECRILAIIDAFDAMINDRPYRKSMPVEAAIAELKKWAGIQFDPGLVEYFTNTIIPMIMESPVLE
ncbi:MAG: PAS domain S-box protein [Syntrophomonadaceae bacterium]